LATGLDPVDKAPSSSTLSSRLKRVASPRRLSNSRRRTPPETGGGGGPVPEIHVHWMDIDGRPGSFEPTLRVIPRRLDVHGEDVRFRFARRVVAEQQQRWPLELDGDLRALLGMRLPARR